MYINAFPGLLSCWLEVKYLPLLVHACNIGEISAFLKPSNISIGIRLKSPTLVRF